ncbi:MAG: hypothetical protein ACRDP6_47305 [Actinoallomurus sp.]
MDLARLSPAAKARIVQLEKSVIHRGDRYLICEFGGTMYLQRRHGDLFAVHHANNACGEKHPINTETDEHKRQKEYCCLSAERNGLQASEEYSTGKGTRVDVLITGGSTRVGYEAQHSKLRVSAAKGRSTKTMNANILPLWTSDSGGRPPWLHHVPSMKIDRNNWSQGMPPIGTAVATGLRDVEMVECTVAFARGQICSVTGGLPCGRRHPELVPVKVATFDDAIRRTATGELVPYRDVRGYVYMVPLLARDLLVEYEIGREWLPGEMRLPSGESDTRRGGATCRADHADVIIESRCQRCGRWKPGYEALCEGCMVLTVRAVAVQPLARDGPSCVKCGQPLLLIRPGRTTCERCRIDEAKRTQA